MNIKSHALSLGVLTLGALCLLSERVLHGGADSNGVLQESFFLPLGSGLVVLGLLLVGVSWFRTQAKTG